jgi:carbon storage regulator
MLVLSRKPAEAIRIGDDIIIKVIAIRGGQVKIGIEAPQEVRVMRMEPHNGELPAAPAAATSETIPADTGNPESTFNHLTSGQRPPCL